MARMAGARDLLEPGDRSAAPREDTEAARCGNWCDAFSRIGDAEIRRRILDLARTLAGRRVAAGAGKT